MQVRVNQLTNTGLIMKLWDQTEMEVLAPTMYYSLCLLIPSLELFIGRHFVFVISHCSPDGRQTGASTATAISMSFTFVK